MQKVAAHTGKIIKLRWSAGRLQLDRNEDEDAERQEFTQIASAAGGGGGSSRSTSSTYSNSKFDRPSLSGEMRQEKPRTGSPKLRFSLTEKEGPRRTLKIDGDPDGEMVLHVADAAGDYLLRFRQSKDGAVMIQELAPDDVFAARADSLVTLCRRYPEFVETRFLPLIGHLGVTPPKTAYDPQIVAAILAELGASPDAAAREFAALLKEMDNENFKVREAATRKVEASIERFRPLVLNAVRDSNTSPEVVTRLKGILRNTGDADALKVADTFNAAKLAADPHFLATLAATIESDEQRQVLTARLAELTGKALGNDADAWRAWSRENAPPPELDLPPVDPLTEKGLFQNVGDHIGRLVKIDVRDGRLQLDRDHWQQPFGGKTIKQLEDEIEAEIEKRHLPKAWFDVQAYRNRGWVHPQALFEHITLAAGVTQRSTSGTGANSTMQCQSNAWQGELQLGTGGASIEEKKNHFQLMLAEKIGPQRTLRLFDDGRGEFRLSLVGENAGHVLGILQRPNVFRVQQIRGGKTFSATATSFTEFAGEHAQHWNEEVLPLVRHLGIASPGKVPGP